MSYNGLPRDYSSMEHGAQDYRCPQCGHVEYDVKVRWFDTTEEQRLYKGEQYKVVPLCPLCIRAGVTDLVGVPYVEMDWLPRRVSHDLLPGGEGSEVDIDGTVHKFSSAHEMHRFEAESQKRAASGDGQAFSFRALHQNRGNMDQNTLKDSSLVRNRQTPHADLGRTSAGRHIGRGVMTSEQAERAARGDR